MGLVEIGEDYYLSFPEKIELTKRRGLIREGGLNRGFRVR